MTESTESGANNPQTDSKSVEIPKIGGRLGVSLAVAVVLFPVASGAAQFIVDWQKSSLDHSLEEEKLSTTKQLETFRNDLAAQSQTNANRLEVNKLFLDHYQSAKPAEQKRIIQVMATLYPVELVEAAKIFNVEAANTAVKKQVQSAESAARSASVPGSLSDAVTTASAAERQGFDALGRGDLEAARAGFLDSYTKFPTYHNVDELAHQVLTLPTIERYKAANSRERREILRSIAVTVLRDYSWGMPPEAKATLHRLALG